jgi:hypothetical protein
MEKIEGQRTVVSATDAGKFGDSRRNKMATELTKRQEILALMAAVIFRASSENQLSISTEEAAAAAAALLQDVEKISA